MNLLLLFIVLSVVNVILQTFKSIATVKCGRVGASLVNATAYGLYTIVLVFTNADFPLWEKVLVTAITNLVGVYIVKTIEEKLRKDKLWKVEATIRAKYITAVINYLKASHISFSTIRTTGGHHTVFNIYCRNQKQSALVKKCLTAYHAKYFVTESKTL